MPWFRWQGQDLVLQVHIQPRASHSEIVGVLGDRLKIRIMAPPMEGRANVELIALLAKRFGVAKGQVTLLQGEKAKIKLIRIQAPTKIPSDLGITSPD